MNDVIESTGEINHAQVGNDITGFFGFTADNMDFSQLDDAIKAMETRKEELRSVAMTNLTLLAKKVAEDAARLNVSVRSLFVTESEKPAGVVTPVYISEDGKLTCGNRGPKKKWLKEALEAHPGRDIEYYSYENHMKRISQQEASGEVIPGFIESTSPAERLEADSTDDGGLLGEQPLIDDAATSSDLIDQPDQEPDQETELTADANPAHAAKRKHGGKK